MNTIIVLALIVLIVLSALVGHYFGTRKGASDLAASRAAAAQWEAIAASRAAALDFQFAWRRRSEVK